MIARYHCCLTKQVPVLAPSSDLVSPRNETGPFGGTWVMTILRLLLAVLIPLIAIAGCSSATTNGDDAAAPSALCTYHGQGDTEVYAPCSEGETFGAKMTELGFADSSDVYMPEVAADTCDKVQRGLPVASWSTTGSEPELNRAFREAEIAAKCPDALGG